MAKCKLCGRDGAQPIIICVIPQPSDEEDHLRIMERIEKDIRSRIGADDGLNICTCWNCCDGLPEALGRAFHKMEKIEIDIKNFTARI